MRVSALLTQSRLLSIQPKLVCGAIHLYVANTGNKTDVDVETVPKISVTTAFATALDASLCHQRMRWAAASSTIVKQLA
jgi:hypothetical protein